VLVLGLAAAGITLAALAAALVIALCDAAVLALGVGAAPVAVVLCIQQLC
jgi:hypothetical protein